jgi:pimeloyl-ACP methyl ester carboxylesterase
MALVVGLASCDRGSADEVGGRTAPSSASSSSSPEPSVPRTAVHFEASDGVRIEGSTFGSGRVGVVLGHGSPGNQTEWWPFAETLAERGYTALAIDFRSFCPGGQAGCSGDGSTADAWQDMLGAARHLERQGVKQVVLMGSSMGGTASVVAASQPNAGVTGAIALSGSSDCCGMHADKQVIEAIDVPILLVVGRLDSGFVGSTRRWSGWAGDMATTDIVPSGEHGLDFFHLATPGIQRRVSEDVFDFLAGVSSLS